MSIIYTSIILITGIGVFIKFMEAIVVAKLKYKFNLETSQKEKPIIKMIYLIIGIFITFLGIFTNLLTLAAILCTIFWTGYLFLFSKVNIEYSKSKSMKI